MSETLKKEVENLLKKEGQVKGDLLRSYFNYIRIKNGPEGVIAIEKKIEATGITDLKAAQVEPFSWYPAGYEPIIVLAGMEEFGWTEEDVFNIGKDITKLSLIVRTMIRFFVSIDKVFEEAPKYWRNNYDFGSIEPSGRDEDGSYILRIKDYDIHPISCIYNAGYIIGITEMAAGKGYKIEETLCPYKGGKYHEYRIKKIT